MFEDRFAIESTLVAYATAIDTRDWDLLRQVFTDDLHADYGDIGEWTSREDLVSFMDAAHQGFGLTHHRLTNFVVTVDGNRATSRTYVHAVLTLSVDPDVWYDSVGHYDDVLVKANNTWRIKQRRFSASRMTSGRNG